MPIADISVLFADESMLVLDKPSGLLSVPGRGEDKQDCLSSRVQRAYPDALVVHRLDMATSGLLVMARGTLAQRAPASRAAIHAGLASTAGATRFLDLNLRDGSREPELAAAVPYAAPQPLVVNTTTTAPLAWTMTVRSKCGDVVRTLAAGLLALGIRPEDVVPEGHGEAVGIPWNARQRFADKFIRPAISINVSCDERTNARVISETNGVDKTLIVEGFTEVHVLAATPGSVSCSS